MKTFTKTMSMILIAVMCFSLFATSAYAMDFSLDGSDGSFSLDANPAPSFSADNDGSFSLSDNFDDSSFSLGTSVAQQVAPVQQAEANSDDSFTLGETTAPKADASDNSVKQDDELIFEVPEDEVERLGSMVRECMEGAFTLSVPLHVEIETGRRWGEMH